jgi:hypothetical protein
MFSLSSTYSQCNILNRIISYVQDVFRRVDCKEYVFLKQRQGHTISNKRGVKDEPRRHPRVCLEGPTFFSLTYGNNSCATTLSFTHWQQAALVSRFTPPSPSTTGFDQHSLYPSSQLNITHTSHHSSLIHDTTPCLEDAMATASAVRQ